MPDRFPLGSVARIYFDIVENGVGILGQAPTVAIQRQVDDKWFQASDGSWQTTPVENPMTPAAPAFLPGRYLFEFDQSLDLVTGSTTYIARMVNAGAPVRLEYRDLSFGPMASVASMALCSVQGVIVSTQATPLANAAVKATLMPVYNGGLGRAVESSRVAVVYTDAQGSFDLPLVRGGIFRLEIDAAGYDRKVTIPDQPSVLFTDL